MDFHGGRAQRIRENVFYLMRGYIFDLQGLSFFVFGGAASHDISDGILRPCEYETEKEFRAAYRRLQRAGAFFRVDHVSWWEAELPSREEMERGIRNLKERGFYADYIVTHCAPSSVAAEAGYDGEDRLSRYLEEIKGKIGFQKWFFGHYHHNRALSEKYIMLYEQILRIR